MKASIRNWHQSVGSSFEERTIEHTLAASQWGSKSDQQRPKGYRIVDGVQCDERVAAREHRELHAATQRT
jgi:hypothetical protein